MEIGEWIKQHKVLVFATGGVVLLFIFLMLRSQSSGAAVASSGVDPNVASIYGAEIAQQGQQQQLTAQVAAQQAQIQGQETIAGLQAGTQIQIAGLQAGLQNENIQAGQQVANAQIASATQANNNALTAATDQITANLQGLVNNNMTAQNIAGIQAGEQVNIAQIQGTTTQAEIQGLTSTTIAEANANASVAKAAISAQKQTATLGGLVGLASAIF